MPVVAPSKSVSRFGRAELKRFITEAGRATVYLQSGRVSSVKAWVDAIVKEIPGLRCRWTPAGSSASQGSVERHVQILFAHARTLRLFLASKLQEATGSHTGRHHVSPLAIKLAQWLLNRHMINGGGLTAYQRCFRQQSLPGLAQVGETMLFKARNRHDLVKADSSFTEVYGLEGTLAMGNTFAADHGVVKSRSDRRLAPSFKWKQDIIMSFKAVPWGFRGDGIFDPSFFFNARCKALSGKERERPGEEREGE